MGKAKRKGKKKGGKASKKAKSAAEKACEKMSWEEKITELIKLGILQDIDKTEEICMEDFVGVPNCLGSDPVLPSSDFKKPYQPDPTLAQCRQFCSQFGVIPLGSTYVREQIPLIPAILLYGPKGVGKSMMSMAIAKSVGARWLDLSPDVVITRLGLKGLELKRIVCMAFHVAEYLKPSVIYVDNIDKVFTALPKRKKGVEYESLPGDLKGPLTTYRDKLTIKKRVLIIGNATAPYADCVEMPDLKKFFVDATQGQELSLKCYMPLPDYGSRLKLWQYFIEETGVDVQEVTAQCPGFSLSNLGFISEGYSAGSIRCAVQKTLTFRRIQKYHEIEKKFQTEEFVQNLAKTPYVYVQDHRKLTKFTAEVSGRLAHLKKIEAEAKKPAEDEEDPKAKKGKKPKKRR